MKEMSVLFPRCSIIDCIVEALYMHWRNGEIGKAGIIIVGMLLLLLLMVWVPVSEVGAYDRASELASPGTVTVQATPTEDATVAALNKEKLAQEVQQLKSQNAPDLLGWLRTNAAILLSTLVVVIGGLIGLFRWFGDRRSEREQRKDQFFQNTISSLGNEKPEAKVIAASMLLTFLQQPGYERFHQQVFHLAVANLRLLPVKPSEPVPPDPLTPPDPLKQALSVVLEQAFPRARKWIEQGSPSTRLQRIIAWLKRILPGEKRFDSRSLDAGRIHLEKAFLWKADLKQIWMPWAFLRGTNLSEADLTEARLWGGADDYEHDGGDFREVILWGAILIKADLGATNLSGADLSLSDLIQAKLWADLTEAKLLGADLTEAKLCRGTSPADLSHPADLSGADLSGADLNGADLRYAKLNKARLCLAILTQGPQLKAVENEDELIKFESQGAKFIEGNRGNLRGTKLRKADLGGATLIWAILRNANFLGADLSEANLFKADLTGAKIEDARSLKGTDLRGVTGLTEKQKEACKARGAIID
jgi:uncharacterized protein YjbI with pentapeptide repeats